MEILIGAWLWCCAALLFSLILVLGWQQMNLEQKIDLLIKTANEREKKRVAFEQGIAKESAYLRRVFEKLVDGMLVNVGAKQK